MGSLRRNPKGKGWQARYRTRAGQQRTKTFATKVEAAAYLRHSEEEVRRGSWHDPALARTRFADYAETWRAGLSHLRPGTLSNVDSRLRLHVLPAFGDRMIGSIEPADVRGFVAELVERGLSAASVHSIYRALERILRTAEVDGVIARSPCIDIRLPRITSHEEMCFLSAAEVTRLADAIEERYRALILTAAYTGMRWGELAGLAVDDVDLERGVIHVRRALTEVNGTVRIGPTKTGKRRSVSLPRFLADLLRDHVERFAVGELVFTSAEGASLRKNFYNRHYKKAVGAAGLPARLRFHDLRHTCAAILIAQGAHPKAIQERLGHSTIRLTFDRYGHLLPSLDDTLRDGLDQLYAETTDGRRLHVVA